MEELWKKIHQPLVLTCFPMTMRLQKPDSVKPFFATSCNTRMRRIRRTQLSSGGCRTPGMRIHRATLRRYSKTGEQTLAAAWGTSGRRDPVPARWRVRYLGRRIRPSPLKGARRVVRKTNSRLIRLSRNYTDPASAEFFFCFGSASLKWRFAALGTVNPLRAVTWSHS